MSPLSDPQFTELFMRSFFSLVQFLIFRGSNVILLLGGCLATHGLLVLMRQPVYAYTRFFQVQLGHSECPCRICKQTKTFNISYQHVYFVNLPTTRDTDNRMASARIQQKQFAAENTPRDASRHQSTSLFLNQKSNRAAATAETIATLAVVMTTITRQMAVQT